MKNSINSASKKLLSVILIVAALFCLASLSSCKEEPLIIKDSDTFIVIKTTEKALEQNPDMLLIDYMATLKEKGELEYEVKNGMISSINGIENPADYSKCWMLYTGDSEYSNSAWGTVVYEGTEYGSAVLGAESLKIKADCIYIWVFKTF